MKRLERSPGGVWTAMDPQRQRLVVVAIGSRPLALAQRVVQQVPMVLAPGSVPRLLTAGLKDYTTARLPHVGPWVRPARRQAKGALPTPRWMPLPELL